MSSFFCCIPCIAGPREQDTFRFESITSNAQVERNQRIQTAAKTFFIKLVENGDLQSKIDRPLALLSSPTEVRQLTDKYQEWLDKNKKKTVFLQKQLEELYSELRLIGKLSFDENASDGKRGPPTSSIASSVFLRQDSPNLSYRLIVQVKRARLFSAFSKKQLRKVQPYVVVSMPKQSVRNDEYLERLSQAFRQRETKHELQFATTLAKDGANPIWEETFVFEFATESPEEDRWFAVEVFNSKSLGPES